MHKGRLKLTLIEEVVKYLTTDLSHRNVDLVKKLGYIHGIAETTHSRNQVVKFRIQRLTSESLTIHISSLKDKNRVK